MELIQQKFLRRVALSLLARFGNRDVTISNHWTGDPLRLNLFKHKGYWWHGRAREKDEIEKAMSLISPGDTVIELGANIGYLTQLFASAVGPTGRVIAFEPSQSNLKYASANVGSMPNVTLEPIAITNYTGVAKFYTEELTGQNNSLVDDYHVLTKNAEAAFIDVKRVVEEVRTDTLTDYCNSRGLAPNFIKIDVEGAEYEALVGAEQIIDACRPKIMIEISCKHDECVALFERCRYSLFTEDGQRRDSLRSDAIAYVFALPD